MNTNRYKEFKKYVAVVLTVTFFHSQLLPVSMASVALEPNTSVEATTTTLEEQAAKAAVEVQAAVVNSTSLDGLMNELVLTPVKDESSEEKKEITAPVTASTQTEQAAPAQASTFEKALEYLNQAKGFAAAIVEKINVDNLVTLAKQAYEFGLSVINGIIVLFTSHEANSLSATADFNDTLTNNASVVAHKQTYINPSQADHQGAQERSEAQGKDLKEYVISMKKTATELDVVRYDGIATNNEVVAAGDLISDIESAYDPAQASLQAVYEYLRSQETTDPLLLELFRSDPPTVFEGLPQLTSFASQNPTASISVDQNSSSNYTVTYDVTNNSFAGTVITWADTEDGFIDLSGLTKYSFELKRNNTACASANATCAFVEFKDSANRVAKVRIVNVGTSFVQKDIPKTALQTNNPNINFEEIVQIAFVFDSQTAKSGTLEVNTGGLAFDPTLDPSTTDPDVTPVPVDSLGNRPALTAFSSNNGTTDYSDVDLEVTSVTEGSFTINQYNTTSFGGGFFTYDDPSTDDGDPDTTDDIETINFEDEFPDGLVLALNNDGTDAETTFETVKFEVTDIFGDKDFVYLTGLEDVDNVWEIIAENFDEVDTTQIQTFAIVTEGRLLDAVLNYTLGNFAFIPSVEPATGDPAITPAPESYAGRPALTSFASDDFSTVTVDVLSKTFAQIEINQYNTTSFGGVFLNYDDPDTDDGDPDTTDDIESIDFEDAFPDGLTLQIDSPDFDDDDGIDNILLEVTDENGDKDEVRLTLIEDFGKKYTVAFDAFDEVDTSKITTLSLIFEGRHVDTHVNIDWGNFAFIPSVEPATGDPAITPVPENYAGRPAFTGFASNDFSNVTVDMVSPTFAQLEINQYNTTSFGGAFINYDDPDTDDGDPDTTDDIESIDFEDAFPDGLTLQIDSPDFDDEDGIDEVLLEVTDENGEKDQVRLTLIEDFGKKYTVTAAAFDEIDTTKVTGLALIFEGRHVDKHINVDWGTFAFIPSVEPATGDPAITPVPLDAAGNRPALTGFASNDFSNVTVDLVSKTFAQIEVNQYNTTSFGGAFITYGTTPFDYEEEFPDGLTLQIDSPDFDDEDGIDEVLLEVTDEEGEKDQVRLTLIEDFGKKYTVTAAAFDEVDTTKIVTISLIFEGRHVDKHVNVDWGNFAFSPSIAPDATDPDITLVPENYAGRPTFTGFASNDFSNAQVVGASPTTGDVELNLYNTTSFGGAFINYDDPDTDDGDPDTTDDIESISFEDAFPDGLVLGLESSDPSTLDEASLEFTDVNDKRYSVVLTDITDDEQRYKIVSSNLDSDVIDLTQIKTIALIVAGRYVGKTLTYHLGNFTFSPSIGPDATDPDVTPVPANYLGRPTFTGFASADFSESNVTATSKEEGEIELNLYNTTSFGGAFINYDDPDTTEEVETIDFEDAFPDGLVLGLASSDPDDLDEVSLEFKDADDQVYTVILTDLTDTEQRYKVLVTDLDTDLIDPTQIKTISLVVNGRYTDVTIFYNWGDFVFIPSISSDASDPDITPLPVTSTGQAAELSGFSSEDSTVQIDVTSETEAELTFDLTDENAFGGAFLSFDDRNTTDDVETIDLDDLFPDGMVMELSNGGTDLSEIILEVEDIDGNKDEVRLIDILETAKRWNIPVTEFDEVDTTKIKTISFVLTGEADGLILDIVWGLWQLILPI